MLSKEHAERVAEHVLEIPKAFRNDMRVPARLYADEDLLDTALLDSSLVQLVNTATLPGVIRYAIAMPDSHQGYGFPIGGVVATRLAEGVLPASYEVDLSSLRAATGARSVSLAKESEFNDRFPECEIGAMPPFGNLYGMAVYVDESLTKDKDIAFNAGSHNELIQVPCLDFERLVKPTVLEFSVLPDMESMGAWHL